MSFRRSLGLMHVVLASAAFAQTSSPFASGVWCGNVTATSASVVVRLKSPDQTARLHVSAAPSLTPVILSSAGTATATAGNTLTLTTSGLQPDTEYHYGVEVAGALRSEPESRGQFRTFPVGRASFKIAFASCSDFRKTDQSAFEAIVAERPLLFIHTGDLHYIDTDSTDINLYRANYDTVLNHPRQSALFRNLPIAYMWDDHDFCGDESYAAALGSATAIAAYRERTPHYPIAAIGGTVAQAFTIGRVRVIMTDLRSASASPNERENVSKSHLGAAQKAWFKQELLNARDAGAPLTLWVSTHPWIGLATQGQDTWSGFATERTEIANFIRDNNIANVVVLSGDMHGLAFDNGTNSDYATGGGAPLTVLHAAALTHDGEIKGGPYSGGTFFGGQQYGILEVFDAGGSTVTCRFSGKRVGEGEKVSYVFNSSGATDPNGAFVNISMLAHVRGGDDTLTSGFVVSGNAPRRVLIRAIGPSLGSFGIGDALERPQLTLYQGSRMIATNDGWGTGAIATDTLKEIFDRFGAFRLLSETSRDAVLVLSLQPGPYTMQMRSADGQAGAALLEVYNAR